MVGILARSFAEHPPTWIELLESTTSELQGDAAHEMPRYD